MKKTLLAFFSLLSLCSFAQKPLKTITFPAFSACDGAIAFNKVELHEKQTVLHGCHYGRTWLMRLTATTTATARNP